MTAYFSLREYETVRAEQRRARREGAEASETFSGFPYLCTGSAYSRVPDAPLAARLRRQYDAGAGPLLSFLARRYGASLTVSDALARLRAELTAAAQPEPSERVHRIDTDEVDGSTQTGDATHGGDSQSGEVPDGESGAGGEHAAEAPENSPSSSGGETAEAETATDGGAAHRIDRALRRVQRRAEKAERNHGHGGVTATLDAPRRALVPKVAAALARLVGAAATEDGPRWDAQELAVRLLTRQHLQRARKEEEGRPLIAVLPDVSGSCGHISRESVALATAAGEAGVPGADILVVAHSNGEPEQASRNGEAVALLESEHGHRPNDSSNPVASRYRGNLDRVCDRLLGPELESVVAVGDNDAIDAYRELAERPGVQRLVWIDHYMCRGGEVKVRRCRYDLTDWSPPARAKVTWVMGCKTADDMLRALRLAIG